MSENGHSTPLSIEEKQIAKATTKLEVEKRAKEENQMCQEVEETEKRVEETKQKQAEETKWKQAKEAKKAWREWRRSGWM